MKTQKKNAKPTTKTSPEKELLERLRVLHEVTNELSKISDPEDLFQTAVIAGREKLRFDRIAFFLLDSATNQVNGTFGTDEEGNLRDERNIQFKLTDDSSMARVLKHNAPFVISDRADFEQDTPNDTKTATHATAALWDGQLIIGFLCMDNMISRRKIAARDCELLSLFATSVGHLYSRLISEQRLLYKEKELRQVQKIEAVGRLAGGIAHDFNNMLTTILGFAWILKKELGPEHYLYRDVDEIVHAGERAAKLTRQLLTFARKDDAVAKTVDVNEVVTDLNRLLGRLLGKDIELACILGRDVGTTRIDPTHLDQVIMNLAVNARDVMPEGGKLYIRTARVHVKNPRTKSEAGDYILLSVKDTGPGIPDHIRNNIFDPFFTTKEEGKGTGLGLSIVDSIVTQVGGFVELMSSPDMGAEFQIYLPWAGAEVETEEKQEIMICDLPEGDETILVVEDDDSVRRFIMRTLGAMGYTVMKASHGGEALRLLEANADMIDLVLTDMMMPHMGGIELVQQMQRRGLQCKVLFTSGYLDQEQFRKEFGDRSRFQLIMKPFTQVDLILKVRDVLGRKAGL
jgi:signal transduction histidine kinase